MRFDLSNPGDVQLAVNAGLVLARGVHTGSAYRDKALKGDRKEETLVQVELRKAARRPGIATQTAKSNNGIKDGNPCRSTCLLGSGGTPFASAGFLKFGFDLKDITSLSFIDDDTGRHKKMSQLHNSKLALHEKQQQLTDLWLKQLQGGSSRRFGDELWTHTECLYHIRNFDAIYFTKDPMFCDYLDNNLDYVPHPYSSILQAIYLQNEHKPKLPIFEYSGTRNFIERKNYTPKDILRMWTKMCSDYIKNELKKEFSEVSSLSIDDIKAASMYGTLKNSFAKKNRPADDNYDDETYGPNFKQKIDANIIKIRDKLLAKYNKDLLEKRNQPLYDRNVFWKLVYSPELRNINPNQIITTSLFKSDTSSASISSRDEEDINTIMRDKEKCDPTILYRQTESLNKYSKEAKSYLLAKKLRAH